MSARQLLGGALILMLLGARRESAADGSGHGIGPSLDTAPRIDDQINNPRPRKWLFAGANEFGGEHDTRGGDYNFWVQPNLEATFRLAPEWNTGFRVDLKLRWDAVSTDYKMSPELWFTIYGMRFRRGPHRLRIYLVNRLAVGDKTALITQADATYIWFFGGTQDSPHSLDVRLVGGPEEKVSSGSYGYYAWLRVRLALLLSRTPLQPTLLLPLRVQLRGAGHTPDRDALSFIFDPGLDLGSNIPGVSVEWRADGSYVIGAFFGRRY